MEKSSNRENGFKGLTKDTASSNMVKGTENLEKVGACEKSYEGLEKDKAMVNKDLEKNQS